MKGPFQFHHRSPNSQDQPGTSTTSDGHYSERPQLLTATASNNDHTATNIRRARQQNGLFFFFIRKTKFPLTSDSREIPRHQTGYIVGDLVHVDLRTRAYNARPMSSKAISHFVA